MPKHADFEKIYKRFVKQYGSEKGKSMYYAWVNAKGYDDTKAFPKKGERKELQCSVTGFELKENDLEYHIYGLLATTHIDAADRIQSEFGGTYDIPDMCTKETLESFATQINTVPERRVVGIHHSEGRPINPEYFATITPAAEVKQLTDGEWGLFVDTVLLKNDPKTPEIIQQFESGQLNAFSITYDTNGFMTADFDWMGEQLVRILNPETQLYGGTYANNPVNEQAKALGYGFKEFKELVGKSEIKEATKMPEQKEEIKTPVNEQPSEKKEEESAQPSTEEKPKEDVGEKSEEDDAEQKEFQKWKSEKKALEEKELLEKTASKIAEGVLKKMEVKESVLKENNEKPMQKEVPLEMKAFAEAVSNPGKLELKEQFRRAAAFCDSIKLDWQSATTRPAEGKEFKHFGVNGTKLEFKGLGITTNQNTDTDYLQSSAELNDVYDPIVYNALNQATVTWNLLAKDDYSKKGNNQVQFTLKTVANATAAFYGDNAVSTSYTGRLKFQTKFKKAQVGVAVNGDMIAAARGGPVSDVFAQEVMDASLDLLEVINAALFAEVGLETASAVIGFEYLADSAGNTTLYSLTRSTTNKLAPDSAGNTYVNGSSVIVSMANLRAIKRNALNEGANKANLVYITNPLQADLLRGKFDDSRRMLTARETGFGFSTDLFVDGIPVFEDTDCNTDDWWLIDLETHRVAIWVPPTLERLGKSSDSEAAFIKTYFAVYNRAPRRIGMIYGNATA